MKPSEKKPKDPQDPIVGITYPATVKGWEKFKKEAIILHYAGYDLGPVTPLGQKSFGALWKLARPASEVDPQRDQLGIDEEYELA